MEVVKFTPRLLHPQEGAQVPVKYENVSKIFRTGDVIYTAVVVARNTGRW
jgi:hypothetical protein